MVYMYISQRFTHNSQCVPYSLSRSIVSDDQGKGGMELYRFAASVVKRANAMEFVSTNSAERGRKMQLRALALKSRACRFSLETKLSASTAVWEGDETRSITLTPRNC